VSGSELMRIQESNLEWTAINAVRLSNKSQPNAGDCGQVGRELALPLNGGPNFARLRERDIDRGCSGHGGTRINRA
jgi:hypothetical protein